MRRSSRAESSGLRAIWLGAVAGAIALMLSPAAAQEPSLDQVLARAGAYVVEFQLKLSGVVAEEQYVQDVRYPISTSSRSSAMLPRHRELKSDLLLVKAPGLDRWLQFRDTFEVDGKPL